MSRNVIHKKPDCLVVICLEDLCNCSNNIDKQLSYLTKHWLQKISTPNFMKNFHHLNDL